VTGAGEVAGLDDAQLLERFVGRHDEAAFETLLRRHGPMVFGVCRRMLRDPQDAEDAFQATFLVLIRKAPSLADRRLVGNWLYGVAYRTALKARGRAARRHRRDAEMAERVVPAAPDEPVWRDFRPVLDDELHRLPAKYRAPVTLCYLEGKTFQEAARELGWPAGTVSGRLARARALLRSRLARRGVTLSAAVLGTLLGQQARAAVSESLLTATANAAQALAAGAASAGAISSPVMALTREVVQAMFMTHVKWTAGLLGAVVLATGASMVTLHRQDEPAAAGPLARADVPPPRAAQPGGQGESKLTTLRKAKVAAAQAVLDERTREFLAGRGTQEFLLEASRRLAESQRELNPAKADLVAALQAHLNRVKEMEAVDKERFNAGRITVAQVKEAEYYRLEAEIWLEQAKGR
jgi:RNA polymerase sigma factor (sigma-70 family)